MADAYNYESGLGPGEVGPSGAPIKLPPSDFVEQAAAGDIYEPKGAAESDPDDPFTLDSMERYGTIVRQSNPGAQEPASMEAVLDNIRRRNLYAEDALRDMRRSGTFPKLQRES